ncbi:MAG: thioesterase [Cyclobacteriaceae bacterium]|nr:MAG: thioesterase [Cyclobacteriaceae bacterium]
MFIFNAQLRVRYADTDQMGYVYYGNYGAYYEVARVESLRNLGYAYKDLEAQGIMMPVLENHSRFLKPAKYDELLRIEVTLKQPPSVRIKFYYRIFNEQDQLIHTGETLLAFVKVNTGKPCRPPEILLKLLSPFFDEA